LHGISVSGANDREGGWIEAGEATDDAVQDPIQMESNQISAPPYQKADLSVRSNVERHDAPLDQLSELVEKIVVIEGPVHGEEVARWVRREP
jgi:hypothetical protein